ncbi:P-loop containing nucleoside triphosphate hydrolase, partial [Globisporangium splendens]
MEQAPWIAVVGEDAVGKRALVHALLMGGGGPQEEDNAPRRDSFQTFRERQQLVTFRDNSCATRPLVCIVVFDLTRRDSFAAAVAQWSYLVTEDEDTHVVLVGTKLDQRNEREVFFDADSMEFKEYVEVSSTQPPFEGVSEVQRLLTKWTRNSDDEKPPVPATVRDFTQPPPLPRPRIRSCSIPTSAPTSHLSSKHKPCIHASVWLYDPTEDHPPSPDQDVKLRPISKALFEIRGAGHDKMKSLAKYKDRETAKLMQRSKYYGPTESSRQMRWQEEQKRLQLETGHVRQRSASQGANVGSRRSDRYREHELIAHKSFIQTTELLRQRKMELLVEKKNALNATNSARMTTSNGTRSLTPETTRSRASQKRTKKLGINTKTLDAVPEEDHTLEPLESPVSSRIRQQESCSRPASLTIDTAAPAWGNYPMPMELMSPTDADLNATIPPAMSPPVSSERRASLYHVPSPSYEGAGMTSDAAGGASPQQAATWQSEQQNTSVMTNAAESQSAAPTTEESITTKAPIDEKLTVETSSGSRSPDNVANFETMTDIDDMLEYFDGRIKYKTCCISTCLNQTARLLERDGGSGDDLGPHDEVADERVRRVDERRGAVALVEEMARPREKVPDERHEHRRRHGAAQEPRREEEHREHDQRFHEPAVVVAEERERDLAALDWQQ